MTITLNEWAKYRDLLSKLNNKAADEFRDYFFKAYGELGGIGLNGIDENEVVKVAYAIAQKYGEAGATLAAEFYDEIIEASGVTLPSAVPADLSDFKEVAKTVNGAMKKTKQTQYIADVVGTIVKKASTDTIRKNARRDRAEYAWIPNGDTCPYCIALASRGWRDASKDKSGDHLHVHCDCTYAVRFKKSDGVEGYNPEAYEKIYKNADGKNAKDKINYLRRKNYAENKDVINEQKREAYAKHKIMEEAP